MNKLCVSWDENVAKTLDYMNKYQPTLDYLRNRAQIVAETARSEGESLVIPDAQDWEILGNVTQCIKNSRSLILERLNDQLTEIGNTEGIPRSEVEERERLFENLKTMLGVQFEILKGANALLARASSLSIREAIAGAKSSPTNPES